MYVLKRLEKRALNVTTYPVCDRLTGLNQKMAEFRLNAKIAKTTGSFNNHKTYNELKSVLDSYMNEKCKTSGAKLIIYNKVFQGLSEKMGEK